MRNAFVLDFQIIAVQQIIIYWKILNVANRTKILETECIVLS